MSSELTQLQQNQLEEEIDLRGTVMLISSRIESILSRIVIIANADNLQDALSSFKANTMNNKINLAIKYLNLKLADLYFKYENNFIELDSLREFRNRFAHSIIEWNRSSIYRSKL